MGWEALPPPGSPRKVGDPTLAVAGGVERAQLVTLGLKYGFNAIGIAKTFVHLGYREGQQPVMWVY